MKLIGDVKLLKELLKWCISLIAFVLSLLAMLVVVVLLVFVSKYVIITLGISFMVIAIGTCVYLIKMILFD